MNQGIWVIAEYKNNALLEVTLETLSELKKLARQVGEEFSVVLMGAEPDKIIEELKRFGVNKIYLVKNGLFDPYTSTVYSRQLVELITKYRPRLVAAGATSSVKDYFPRVAATIKAGLVTNCCRLTLKDNGILHLSKPMYGGKIYSNMVVPAADIIMATVKPGSFSLSKPKSSLKDQVEVIEVEAVPVFNNPIKKLGHVEPDPKSIEVSEAELILAAGRGLESQINFERLEELAEAVGAVVGGTRAAVDSQWVPYEKQIGQSGKTVDPEIYMACGISGASHHTQGIHDSKLIIAINKDRHAPLLKIADVGVVADVNEIISEMLILLRSKNSDNSSEYPIDER